MRYINSLPLSDGRLLNLTSLRSNTKVWKILIREMLFAEKAADVTHLTGTPVIDGPLLPGLQGHLADNELKVDKSLSLDRIQKHHWSPVSTTM